MQSSKRQRLEPEFISFEQVLPYLVYTDVLKIRILSKEHKLFVNTKLAEYCCGNGPRAYNAVVTSLVTLSSLDIRTRSKVEKLKNRFAPITSHGSTFC
jgi:hypothetical protein